MKKTVQVNLSGQVFTLDDDAYDRISLYLKQIERLYASSPGKDEILQDIEVRIAELLTDRLGENKMVVNLADVEAVIEIMGRPEQFDEDQSNEDQQEYTFYQGSRLYRDPDDKVVGGVCSGVGYYFGVDPIFIRLAFVVGVVFFGTGILLYLILMVIIPEARTAEEKWRMRGEPVNIGSIGKSIEDEINAFGERISKEGGAFGRKGGKKLVRGIDRLFHFISELFRNIFSVLGKFLGFLFIVFGLIFLSALFAGLFGIADVIHFDNQNWSTSMDLYEWGGMVFDSSEWLMSSVTALLLLIGIPFIALVYGGYTLLFPKNRVPYLATSLFGLWFVGLIFAIFSTFGMMQSFSKSDTAIETFDLDELKIASDTIRVELGEDPFNIDLERAYRANEDFMIKIENDLATIGNVHFTVMKTNDEDAKLEIVKSSKGSTFETAHEKAERIEYGFSNDSLTIFLNAYFSFPSSDLIRDQEVKIVLYLPEGETVYLSESMLRIIDDIPNVDRNPESMMVEHYWIMQKEGLACSDCKQINQELNETIDTTTIVRDTI